MNYCKNNLNLTQPTNHALNTNYQLYKTQSFITSAYNLSTKQSQYRSRVNINLLRNQYKNQQNCPLKNLVINRSKTTIIDQAGAPELKVPNIKLHEQFRINLKKSNLPCQLQRGKSWTHHGKTQATQCHQASSAGIPPISRVPSISYQQQYNQKK